MEASQTYGRVHSLESFGSVDGPGVRYVIFLYSRFLALMAVTDLLQKPAWIRHVLVPQWTDFDEDLHALRAFRVQSTVQNAFERFLHSIDIQRLCNVGIHAGIQAFLNILGKGIGRQGDDGDGSGIRTGQGADGLGRRQPVHHRPARYLWPWPNRG